MKIESKLAHTPGPWTSEVTNAGEIGSKDKVRVEAADGHIAIICRIQQNNARNTFGKELNVHRNLQEVKANARLIAAAPDLLSLLDTIAGELGAWRCSGDPRPATWADVRIRRIHAAIAKAKGGI